MNRRWVDLALVISLLAFLVYLVGRFGGQATPAPQISSSLRSQVESELSSNSFSQASAMPLAISPGDYKPYPDSVLIAKHGTGMWRSLLFRSGGAPLDIVANVRATLGNEPGLSLNQAEQLGTRGQGFYLIYQSRNWNQVELASTGNAPRSVIVLIQSAILDRPPGIDNPTFISVWDWNLENLTQDDIKWLQDVNLK